MIKRITEKEGPRWRIDSGQISVALPIAIILKLEESACDSLIINNQIDRSVRFCLRLAQIEEVQVNIDGHDRGYGEG